MKHEEKEKNQQAEIKPDKAGQNSAREDSAKSAAQIPSSAKQGEAQIKKPEDEQAVLQDRLLRLQAEFENYKKRMLKEREELIQYANGELIGELLDIVDNLERAVDSAEKKHDDKLLNQGVRLILKDMRDFLKRQNVSPMHCLGEKFDPHKHEAVMQVELADQPEGTVVEEVRKGYQAGARVIRPAMVKVSKKPAEKEEEKPEDKEEKDKENG